MATMTQTDVERLGELRPIHEVVPSPLNPRKSIDQGRLEELAASIRSKGIIEPLIVRTRPGLGQLEIVAGERRYRAAKMAALDRIPVIVRVLSDVEVLELIAIENSQRDDLHPLEEAAGYQALMKADASYTAKAIAAKIGKSERYVHQRLQLGRLEAPVQKAFLANQVTAGHADLISRLKPEDQKAALKACFHNLFGEDKERGAISVRALDSWIESNVRLQLTADDPQTEYFPELAQAVETREDTSKVLQVAGSWLPPQAEKAVLKGALPSNAYKHIEGKKDRCAHAQRAVVIIGTGRGKFIEVCTARTSCQVHWKYEIEQTERLKKEKTRTASGSATRGQTVSAAKKKADSAEKKRREDTIRRQQALTRGVTEFHKHLPTKPTPALLALLAFQADCKPTWANLAREATFNLDYVTPAEFGKAAALLKPFGIDLVAIHKSLTVSQTSATKKGKL